MSALVRTSPVVIAPAGATGSVGQPRPGTAGRASARERFAFSAATAVGLLHGLDDAFLHRQPGVPVSQHALAALAMVIAVGVAVLVSPRARPGVRAGIATILAAPTMTNGALREEAARTAEDALGPDRYDDAAAGGRAPSLSPLQGLSTAAEHLIHARRPR